MRRRSLAVLAVLVASRAARAQDRPLLGLHDVQLHAGAFDMTFSGTFDFEHYVLQTLAPGLLNYPPDAGYTSNPRMSLFFDATIGERFYAFVQLRADRGFDPNWKEKHDERIDELFARYKVVQGRWKLFAQIGKFATPIGNWVPRHGSLQSAFIRAPIVYDTITGVPDRDTQTDNPDFLHHRDEDDDRQFWVPMIWGPAYHEGGMLFATWDRWEARVAYTNGAPSERTAGWDQQRSDFGLYGIASRVGWNPFMGCRLGASYAKGPYQSQDIRAFGVRQKKWDQTLFGLDVEYGIGHLELWGEAYWTSWQLPHVVGTPAAIGYYGEAKYDFLPGFYGALRLGEVQTNSLGDGFGGRQSWDRTTWRAEAGAGYFVYTNLLAKAEYEANHTNGPNDARDNVLSLSLTLSF